MLKRFIPTYHAKNIYEIGIDFYINNNIKTIISDLDNTLDAFDTFEPTQKAIELIKKLKENDIELIIISNNHNGRVTNYSNLLGVKCLSNAHKPFKRRLNNYLNKYQINRDNAIIIGDQTVTDIACGNKCGLKTILVDKLVERDQPTTKFNRIFDKRIRKKLIKLNLLNEIGGNNNE